MIDTATNAVLQTIDLAPYLGAKVGASPNALALAPNGKALYVANAGDNDAAVVRLPPGNVVGQVFGSLGKGNGDPTLNLFGKESAPNQRALERRFVTLDNAYAASEVSADGWNWSTQAYANRYNQKNWPADYADGDRNRGYDFEGGYQSVNVGKTTADSFIWDRLFDAGISFRNYGFHATGTVPALVDPTEPHLVANTDLNFPGFNLHVTDQARISEWLKELNAYKASGTLPAVELVRLPSDHNAGTAPGYPTPRAMEADNDLALGKLVDAVSHSTFWKSTAIFVIEDDAQDGPDHVDAHRTTMQVISPYTQTGEVDSTFYSTVSMLRTMELIIGIPPLTQFDAQATPMTASFTAKPDFRPYDAIVPSQSLTQMNTALAPMALESAKLPFGGADEAPTRILNEAIWKSVKGARSTMPAPVHRR